MFVIRTSNICLEKIALSVGLLVLLVLCPGCPSAPTVKSSVLAAGVLPEDTSGKGGAVAAVDGRNYLIETISGVALIQLYADGFDKLGLNEKLLAYYLYKAAIAGRDISYDQNHRWALTVRRLLDQILSHPLGLRPATEQKLLAYAKLYWLNNGPYSERNKTKFLAPFTAEELLEALGVAKANGADFSSFGKPLEDVVLEVAPLLFEEDFEPLVTNKNPGSDGDVLRDSANNYYHGVTLADLEGFEEKYPLNSRLVKECPRGKECRLTEEVYRIGEQDEKGRKWVVEPGLYATQLSKVVEFLELALPYATEQQGNYLRHLVRFFKTGDPADFDSASVAWLKTAPPVDVILGFIETYKDPRSQKGDFEGLVYYEDRDLTSVMKGIADHAAYFEERTPWDEKYKNLEIKVPVASAINVLLGVGHAGPNIPIGINLPNAQWIRESHGSRSVLLSNVLSAARAGLSDAALKEFALPEEQAAIRRYRESVGRTMVALHEVVGHGSGKAGPELQGDPAVHLQETYSTLEEARAELLALHHIFDPKLVEIGALPGAQAAVVAYADYVRKGLVQLRRVKEGNRFEDDHMRATHLIVSYILRNSKAVDVRDVEGKTYYVLTDVAPAREAVANLLTEIMRIKAVGDVAAARKLVNEYAIEFDAALRDEVVERAEEAGVPDFVAFHCPTLRMVRDESGIPVDVVAEYTRDFLQTMLEWDIMGPR